MSETLPYWLVNVPEDQRPATCPEFLRDIPEKLKLILSTPDSQYRRFTWPQVKEIVRENHIDAFQRLPSDMRRYLGHMVLLKKSHGSVMNFVLTERLGWKDLTPAGPPFSNSEKDIKIRYNDWPYGVDKKIVHLVVWVKFELQDDPLTDDLTPEARTEIAEYVRDTFCTRVNSENVVWFKNWRSIKSVHAIEHFHVMLYDPDPEFIKEVTNGDQPISAKIGFIDEV